MVEAKRVADRLELAAREARAVLKQLDAALRAAGDLREATQEARGTIKDMQGVAAEVEEKLKTKVADLVYGRVDVELLRYTDQLELYLKLCRESVEQRFKRMVDMLSGEASSGLSMEQAAQLFAMASEARKESGKGGPELYVVNAAPISLAISEWEKKQ